MEEDVSAGWVKFENTTPDNLKVGPLSDKAFRLWFNAICYCSRGRTSGKVPAAVMPSLSLTATKRTVVELLEAGLLEQLDAKTYLVHDYLDYNPSRERIEEMKTQNRERVAQWRAERAGNGVTGEGDVTALRADYSRVGTRDRTAPLPSPSRSSQDESKPRRSRVDQAKPPADFPPDKLPVLADCLSQLRVAWDLRGGIEPHERGVGLGIMRNERADHAGVARRLVHWLTAGSGQRAQCKDIAMRFGDWVADEPAAGRVVQMPSRKESPSDLWRAINGPSDFIEGSAS